MDLENREICRAHVFTRSDFSKKYEFALHATVNERLEILYDEMKRNIHYLTGPYAEALISLSMLNEHDMQRVQSKNREFLLTFNSLTADVDESEMKRSKYSSKYSFCLYYYRSYDLRNLHRDTWFEYGMLAIRFRLLRNCFMADAEGNIYTDRFLVPGALSVLKDAFSLIEPSTSSWFDSQLWSEQERIQIFAHYYHQYMKSNK